MSASPLKSSQGPKCPPFTKDVQIRGNKSVGWYSDAKSRGLYLKVSAGGGKSFVFRYKNRNPNLLDPKSGKPIVTRYLGIGPYGVHDVTLDIARKVAATCRQQLRDGLDPIIERDRERAANAPALVKTFKECCADYIKREASGWKNLKHKAQWAATLRTYAEPVIGHLPVNQVDDHHVTEVLEPIWLSKHETARRLRGRLESVLDWATAKKYRKGLNPARLKGHQDKLLPAVPKVTRKKKHHAALPYAQMQPLIKELRGVQGNSARALEFLILTAGRSGEVFKAEWSEIDFDTKVWTVPADKMKMERAHRVPLCDAAVKVLKAQKGQHDQWVFPGIRKGKHLSTHAMLMLLRDRREGITVHGFRSSFRTWAAEKTNFGREVCEAALAHANDDDVEDAYLDTDYLQQRVSLMDRWAKQCDKAAPKDNIVTLKQA